MSELYGRLHKQLLDEMADMRKHYDDIYRGKFEQIHGVTLDQFIYDVTEKSLAKLKQVYLGDAKSHLWIGINPPPDKYDMKQLYDKFKNLQFKWLDGALWTIEQNTANGIRSHIHLMVMENVKPHRVIEQLSAKLSVNRESIDVKKFTKGKGFQEHEQYIKGIKKDEKMENVEKDRNDRDNLGIPHFIKIDL